MGGITGMTTPILFYSTNRDVPRVGLGEALLQGLAGDRGLFMPEEFPPIGSGELAAWAGLSYSQIACNVLARFTTGVIDEDKLAALCEDAYDYEVPLEHVTGRRYLMRLDRGPTASFKDFAARMMARWMGLLMEHQEGSLVILTATSGDTGSAVAHAYHGLERVSVVVLFPVDEVSDRQRKQMTTLGGNVTTIGIPGKFDDCQALIKRAFSDPDLSAIRLTSANSINIGRLLPQAVYYIYAYVKLARAEEREPVIFSVPSGNFGDMMGAVIARKIGLPTSRLHLGERDLGAMTALGNMAEEVVCPSICVVPIDKDVPLQVAALVGCGVTTGVGAAIKTAQVQPGSTVAVFGCGGVGLCTIQGARLAGADRIIAVDLADNKLEMAQKFGATDTVNGSSTDPVGKIREMTDGIGVDYGFEVIGIPSVVEQAYNATRRGGKVTVVGVGKLTEQVSFNALMLSLDGKTICGCMYGNVNPRVDFPNLLDLNRRGKLDLEGLVTNTYSIDDAPQAFADLQKGLNARGVIVFDS